MTLTITLAEAPYLRRAGAQWCDACGVFVSEIVVYRPVPLSIGMKSYCAVCNANYRYVYFDVAATSPLYDVVPAAVRARWAAVPVWDEEGG